MNLKIILVILLTNSSIAALFCQTKQHSSIYQSGWIDFNKNGKKDIFEDPNQPLEKRVDDLLSQMNLDEKTCQLTTLYGSGRVLKDKAPTPEWKQQLWKDGIANIDEQSNGLGFRNSNFSYPYKNGITNKQEIQKWFVEATRLGIPVDFTNEGIRGLCHEKATYFPSQSAQGATWDKELIHMIGQVTGKEAKALGYTNIYSPILDLSRDPRWGRVVECYSEDPFLTGALGKEMILGLQNNGVASTVKHFAVYSVPVGGRDGDTRTDPHVTPQQLYSLFLTPFRKAVKEAGVMGVMSSYNDYNGEPITGSKYFLTDLLRDKWGFKGYVVSDSEAVEYIYSKHRVAASPVDAVAAAINAGLNVRTNFTPPEEFTMLLRQAVKENKVSMSTIDERVREVLAVKFRLGLFDNPYRGDTDHVDQIVHSDKHKDLSMRAALESVVLLKNSDHALPLSKNIKKISVIGPNADESKLLVCRYGPFNAPIKTVLQGIKEMLPSADVEYSKGCDILDKNFPESELYDVPLSAEEQKMIDDAVEIAKKSEVAVVVLGGNEETVRESYSRTNLNLPPRQEQLLKAVFETGTPTVLVLMDGRAVAINWANKYIPSIIFSGFLGEFTGDAIAKVIFGDYNPGGKLAVTFPKSVGQIPLAFPFKPAANSDGFIRANGALYPFGYGLSYSKFEYSGLSITPTEGDQNSTFKVSFTVTNRSDIAGDEIVQLYIRDDVSTVTTYDKSLRGFERIRLKANESKKVEFNLVPDDLAIWIKDETFVVEPGTFTIMVGASSEDVRLEGVIEVRE